MKKFLSLLMAALLVLSLGVTAFATAPVSEVPVDHLDASATHDFTFDKVYVDGSTENNKIAPEKMPVEQLEFDITGNNVVNAPQISVKDTPSAINPRPITVTVTPADKVTLGKYNYTITERTGETPGVSYTQPEINVQIMISKKSETSTELVETVTFTDGEKGSKVTSITNTFKTASMSVDKVVKGTMGDVNQKFKIHVTLTSQNEVLSPITFNGKTIAPNTPDNIVWKVTDDGTYTYTGFVELNDGDTVATIGDLPEGIEFTVVEDTLHTEIETGKDYSNLPAEGYTAAYTVDEDKTSKGTIAVGKTNAVVVTNTKGGEIDTGINLDVLPYIIILTVAVLGTVLFAVKRRSES